MRTVHLTHRSLLRALCLPLLLLAAAANASAQTSGATEPPLVVFGKVLHVDSGSTFQVFDGTLQLTLTNAADSTNSVTMTKQLRLTGGAAQFSYQAEFPQTNLPPDHRLDTTLKVGFDETEYFVTAAIVDGEQATLLNRGAARVVTSYEKRADLHRLDLMVTLPQQDRDGDGQPDWWEELHGLNPLFAGDANTDLDGDGLDNLSEFKTGTNPGISNHDPEIIAPDLSVPVGGTAGMLLTVVDTNTEPQNLVLHISDPVLGLTFNSRSSGTITPGGSFTYADILRGDITIAADTTFDSTAIDLTLTDTTGENLPNPFRLQATPYSPDHEGESRPALWLQPDTIQTTGPVAEWPDSSTADRDAYQPVAGWEPEFDSAVSHGLEFAGTQQFAYLNDRAWSLQNFTAFLAFRPDALAAQHQTLFNAGGLKLEIGGGDDAMTAQTLIVRQNNRMIAGPPLTLGTDSQFTIVAGSNRTYLTSLGASFSASQETGNPLPVQFPTLGAEQAFSSPAASNQFDGGIYEMLVFDNHLDAAGRARIEDYQLSRWNDVVVWNYRNETAPMTLRAYAGRRNSITGGWGNDELHGAESSDILRGGPGDDLMAGHGESDRFQIFKDEGDDTIQDFSELEHDVLDLTPIFGGLEGDPENFLNIRTQVVPRPGAIPTVNAIIELDYDGDGSGVDQTVTLRGATYTNSDIERLVGQGSITLGGPIDASGMTLVPSESSLTETTTPRSVTITRDGNFDATLDVELSFVGTATVDQDYAIGGASGEGAVRTVSFESGEISKQITLTPIQDTTTESEQIEIAVLPNPLITSLPPQPLVLPLEDAPVITVAATEKFAERLGATPGRIQLHRSGDLTDQLEVAIEFTGSAVNGQDYQPVSSILTFPGGAARIEVPIIPISNSPLREAPAIAQITVSADSSRFALQNPWTASVQIVDAIGDEPTTFAAWKALHFLGDTSADLASLDSDQDRVTNLTEYLQGTDPNSPSGQVETELRLSADKVEIHTTLASGVTDAHLVLRSSRDTANQWQPIDQSYDLSYIQLPGNRYKRIYRLPRTHSRSFFRLDPTLLPAPQLLGDTAEVLGTPGTTFLAGEGTPWLASHKSSVVIAPPLALGGQSSMRVMIDGPFTAGFEWRSDGAHRISAIIDGVEVAEIAEGLGWQTATIGSSTAGTHGLSWKVERISEGTPTNGPTAIRSLTFAP